MRIGFLKKTYKQAVVNVAILVLILGLFIYLGVQFSQNFSNLVSTQRTQVVTDTDYFYGGGYVFRNESPLSLPESGVCDYLVEDGARVGANMDYGVFYPYSGDAKARQAELNDVSLRIRRLTSKLSADGYVSELPSVEERLKNSYYSYINSVLEGNFPSADVDGDRLLGAMVDRNVITGREGEVEDVTKLLESKKAEIINGLGSSGSNLSSGESFYLSYTADGFEKIFSSDKIDGITPELLEDLEKSSPEVYGGNVMGRAIHSPEWFFAMAVDAEGANSFLDADGNVKTGERLEVTFTDEGDTVVIMTLEDLRFDEDGDGIMILSSFDLSLSYSFSRAQSVKIKLKSVTGYRIPKESIAFQGDENGVYILVGTVVKFRRVDVIGEGNGYYIVETKEKNAAKPEGEVGSGSTSEYPYLNVNDLIITSGNDLYDGKLID